MTAPSHRATPADVARLVTLAAIWGASFAFMRVLAPALGPLWTATLRVLIAGVAVVAWLAFAGVPAGFARHAKAYLVVGVLNSALPFALYAYAALRLPASYMVVLNAGYPLFAALLAPIFLGERWTLAKALGLASGVAGVALLSGAGPLALDAAVVAAILACLGATLCYALAAIWLKRHATGIAPLALSGWSQLAAALVLLPFAFTEPLPGTWTPAIAANLLAIALLSGALAYLLYFRLIRDLGPTRASTVTLLMPAFGILWGALFLGERVTLPMLAGLALVVAGVVAVFRPRNVVRRGGARAVDEALR